MKSSNGFTLIELMIVMAIVALLMSFVGPMAMNSLERAEAKSELMELKQLIVKTGQYSFATGKTHILKLQGKSVEVYDSTTSNTKKYSFSYLFFQPRDIRFNNRGIADVEYISTQYRERVVDINIFDLMRISSVNNN